MPRRTDLKKILIIGSGPIVIGQACEFDYSGTQACKALRQEGYEVVLINSNPATIMTDPETADRVYIEPIREHELTQVIAKERPDALLPTLGGQTALNEAINLAKKGILELYGVALIGASVAAIEKAEDRDQFRTAMEKVGLDMPRSKVCRSVAEVVELADIFGLPLILRPSFTLGGAGGSIAYHADEIEGLAAHAINTSPTGEVLVDESILGWKEFELEVMRDRNDNVVIICSIENVDPMGVHTGDSITVAPAQTLTDRQYQYLRDAAILCLREIGVDTGGSNVQFGVCPDTGRVVIIEMNPRVSRSSALASKATGYPIAKIAALLAVGYTLDEITNDITRTTPASFEPTIDYVVTKIPRFTFEKFPGTKELLGTQMQSVGEAMAIGRCFAESVQKAFRSMEIGSFGFERVLPAGADSRTVDALLAEPHPRRLWRVADAVRLGYSVERLFEITKMDRWFLREIAGIVELESKVGELNSSDLSSSQWKFLKGHGFSDVRLATLLNTSEDIVRETREAKGVAPVYKRVDTCAAEFEAHTPYLYSTYEEENEARVSDREKVLILGGGPNRIGQGIEFDYCCVHASQALAADGYETIMMNCNPETVSTDYDTSDRLYFEPLTLEDVLSVVELEKPKGLIVQFGGQTPLSLARALEARGVPILGTSPDAIDRAEDRERFQTLVDQLGLQQPPNGIARRNDEALAVAERIGYPVVVRPSYVLGGRAMEVVFDSEGLTDYMTRAVRVSPEHPVLIDYFLVDAIELDVDCVSDGHTVVVAGIMEHVEEAGIHSGDSACCLPPHSLGDDVLDEIRRQSRLLAIELGVVGLMNIQFAVQARPGETPRIFLLEVNPRASRTVPFVSKAIGIPLAKVAARVMAGKTLVELGITHATMPRHYSVKEAVFPFVKFAGADTILGPEMKSTGEVMGIGGEFSVAYLKAQLGAGTELPRGGNVLISVDDYDKNETTQAVAKALTNLGFGIYATAGTGTLLREAGVEVKVVKKQFEGSYHTIDAINDGLIDLVVCTTRTIEHIPDSRGLRQTAVRHGIPYFTTLVGARAALSAMESREAKALEVCAIQEYHSATAKYVGGDT